MTDPTQYNPARIDALEFEPRAKANPLFPPNAALNEWETQSVQKSLELLAKAAKLQEAALIPFEEFAKKAAEAQTQLDCGESSVAGKLPIKVVEDDSIGSYDPGSIGKAIEKATQDLLKYGGAPGTTFAKWAESLGADHAWNNLLTPDDEPAAGPHLGKPNPTVLEIPLG